MDLKIIEMKKIMLLLLLTAIFASCSSDSFKIDGNIANLDAQLVRVLFQADSAIVDERINVDKKGGFSFEGESAQPILVSVLNIRGETLARMVAVNGDHLKISGDAGKAMGVKVKGNRLNEDWQLFRNEHAAFYTDPNPSRLDAAIEKYVKEHPRDMLSTVLLVADYSNFSDQAKVEQMLSGIDAQARPESITEYFTSLVKGRNSTKLPRLMTLTLAKNGSDFEEIKLTDKVTLINLWAQPQSNRGRVIDAIAKLDEEGNGTVKVLDVLVESDTIRWHQTIADDPKAWSHYWAPGGPLEQGLQLLGITSAPWYAVTDSTGIVLYSGPSVDAAVKAASHAISPAR